MSVEMEVYTSPVKTIQSQIYNDVDTDSTRTTNLNNCTSDASDTMKFEDVKISPLKRLLSDATNANKQSQLKKENCPFPGKGQVSDIEADVEDKFVSFVNKDAKITPSPLIQYVLDVDQPYDLIISCADGKIGAHRLVVASAAPFVGDMFNTYNHRLGETAVLVLPDIRCSIMRILLNFCYTGTMYFSVEEEEEVLEAMKMLQLGVYYDVSLNKVVIRKSPEPCEDSNLQNPTREIPSTSENLRNDRKQRVDELRSSLSDEEEGDDNQDNSSSDSNSEYEADVNRKVEEIKERVGVPKEFLKMGREKDTEITDDDSAPYEYLIGPKEASCKIRKLHCYYCVGVFKSLETLSVHLENNHGISLESRKVERKELKKLLFCDRCSRPHDRVSDTNACLSKRHKTRCYICLESCAMSDYPRHIKEEHAICEKNGMCVVKCRWCDAGIVLEEPICNKGFSAHCYSQHMKDSEDLGGKTDSEEANSKDDSNLETTVSSDTESIFIPTPIKLNRKPEDPKLNSKLSLDTPCSDPVKVKRKEREVTLEKQIKEAPSIIEMLQRASLKRKRNVEDVENEDLDDIDDEDATESGNKVKRSRTEEPNLSQLTTASNPTMKSSIAPGTGIPRISPLAPNLSNLRPGVPRFKSSTWRGKVMTESVEIDVKHLPNIFIKLTYGKTHVLDNLDRYKNCSELPDTPVSFGIGGKNISKGSASGEKGESNLKIDDVTRKVYDKKSKRPEDKSEVVGGIQTRERDKSSVVEVTLDDSESENEDVTQKEEKDKPSNLDVIHEETDAESVDLFQEEDVESANNKFDPATSDVQDVSHTPRYVIQDVGLTVDDMIEKVDSTVKNTSAISGRNSANHDVFLESASNSQDNSRDVINVDDDSLSLPDFDDLFPAGKIDSAKDHDTNMDESAVDAGMSSSSGGDNPSKIHQNLVNEEPDTGERKTPSKRQKKKSPLEKLSLRRSRRLSGKM